MLRHQMPLAYFTLIGLNSALTCQLHLDNALLHTQLLLLLILLPHLLLPLREFRGIAKILFISLEDLVLLGLFLLQKSILPQDRCYVLPHHGLFQRSCPLLAGLRRERALSHPLSFDPPSELLKLCAILRLRHIQLRELRSCVLGCQARLLLFPSLSLLSFHLGQSGLVNGRRHRQRFHLPADDLRLGDEPRLRLGEVERLGRSPPSLLR
mmetsp:Transcript_54108/g.125864  ORF Transcript_54108/g.125864 Transcript_54108/m.125864 type:complete len:210 (-) Transcript_54108:663-1292(-)